MYGFVCAFSNRLSILSRPAAEPVEAGARLLSWARAERKPYTKAGHMATYLWRSETRPFHCSILWFHRETDAVMARLKEPEAFHIVMPPSRRLQIVYDAITGHLEIT